MVDQQTGSCHCQKINFSVSGKSNFEFLCHCEDCNKINGGGHLAGIAFSRENLSVSGECRVYSYPGGSGKNIDAHFCGDCGTPLYAYVNNHPEIVVIRANALGSDEYYLPKKSLFPEQARKWDKSIISS